MATMSATSPAAGSSKRASVGPAAHASPARKRQRVSPASSDGEDQDYWELDSDGLAALEEIERSFTQQPDAMRATSPTSDEAAAGSVVDTAGSTLSPTRARSPALPVNLAFVRPSAAAMEQTSSSRSPSPDASGEKDFSSWFDDSTSHSADFLTSKEIPSFSLASGKTWALSASAIEKAAARFKTWEQEDEKEEDADASTSNILKPISNIASRPSTPKPAAFAPASAAVSRARASSIAPPSKSSPQQTPVTPVRPPVSAGSSSMVPRPAAGPTSAAFGPTRMLGITPRARALQTLPKFVSPFKAGFRPSSQPPEATPSSSHQVAKSAFTRSTTYPSAASRSTQPATTKPGNQQPSPPTSPVSRPNLADSTLRPGQWTPDELEDVGIPSYMFQITPRSALYFAFTPPTSGPGFNLTQALGPTTALDELLKEGHHHATQQWVENHWGLILWKLSGLVVNDPEPYEALLNKWSWAEVLKQLRYRYQRELVDGARPALRAVLERDANAGAPMVLCVSAITWTAGRQLPDGTSAEPTAQLELTDGWYFVRATVDAAITRGIKGNTLKVGRKISCQGAKLDPPHADGKDVWSAYSNSALVLTGNSCSMAPWYAKLGFHPQGFTAGLRSLTPDGGIVALIDVVVVKAYPAGFLEYKGDGTKDGPRNEAEEREMVDQWRAKRAREQERLMRVFEQQAFAAEGMLDKLQRIAGNGFNPGDDESMPDHIEDLYEEISEDPHPGERLKSVSAKDAGWMAQFLKEKSEKDSERFASDLESELAAACPERNVRSFRVLRVQDARELRRPTTRTAQLTVWDAAHFGKDVFVDGARFQVTNVLPTQERSWGAPCEPDSEIFLMTRRNSKVKLMPRI